MHIPNIIRYNIKIKAYYIYIMVMELFKMIEMSVSILLSGVTSNSGPPAGSQKWAPNPGRLALATGLKMGPLLLGPQQLRVLQAYNYTTDFT